MRDQTLLVRRIYAYVHICVIILLGVKFLATRRKRLLVNRCCDFGVVSTGVGVVLRLGSYIRVLSEIEKSCVVCLWSDPMNVKA